MREFVWAGLSSYQEREALARRVWSETVRRLPVGSPVSAEVISRQPFGAFLGIKGHPDAIGLSEVTAMPKGCRCLDLPEIGEHVTGAVIWHASHNHQVKIQLDAWAQHPNAYTELADAVGHVVMGTVTKFASIGVAAGTGVGGDGFSDQHSCIR